MGFNVIKSRPSSQTFLKRLRKYIFFSYSHCEHMFEIINKVYKLNRMKSVMNFIQKKVIKIFRSNKLSIFILWRTIMHSWHKYSIIIANNLYEVDINRNQITLSTVEMGQCIISSNTFNWPTYVISFLSKSCTK